MSETFGTTWLLIVFLFSTPNNGNFFIEPHASLPSCIAHVALLRLQAQNTNQQIEINCEYTTMLEAVK